MCHMMNSCALVLGVVAWIASVIWRPLCCTGGYDDVLFDTHKVFALVLGIIGGGGGKQILMAGKNSLVFQAVEISHRLFDEQQTVHIMSTDSSIVVDKQTHDAVIIAPASMYARDENMEFFGTPLVVAYLIRSLREGGTFTVFGLMASAEESEWMDVVCSMKNMDLVSNIQLPVLQTQDKQIAQKYILHNLHQMRLIQDESRCTKCFLHATNATQIQIMTFRKSKGMRFTTHCTPPADSVLF